MKPRLKKGGGGWYCMGAGQKNWGFTPRIAFYNWLGSYELELKIADEKAEKSVRHHAKELLKMLGMMQ